MKNKTSCPKGKNKKQKTKSKTILCFPHSLNYLSKIYKSFGRKLNFLLSPYFQSDLYETDLKLVL